MVERPRTQVYRWFLACSYLAVFAAAGLPLVALRAAQPPAQSPHGEAQRDCAACHSAERWTPVSKPAAFDHGSTGFLLEGSHARASCRDCHRSLVFERVGTSCADCHRDPHQGELGFRCEACHTPRTWSAAQRSMAAVHARTRFPLVGVHANVDCDGCHRGQKPAQYATTATECSGCHAQAYLNARQPNHAAGGFSRSCEGCHTTSGWRPATGIDHNTTRFPLTGAHQAATCARCHVGGRTTGTPTDCWSCHQTNYNGTSNPSHVSAGFPRTCQSCHVTTAWRPASAVDHSKTRFPLTGAHQALDCARCHVGGRFAGTSTDCGSCHLSSYNGARNPSHAGFPTTCQDCHGTTGWRPASFDHGRTRFPLAGAHRSVECGRCHQDGRYAGTPRDCNSCHQRDYGATTNPNHRAASFPTTCQDCHTTNAWRPASFDHDRAFFPINSGRHRGVWSGCGECHPNAGNYRAFECINCHTHSKSETDRHHREVRGYQYNSASCYRCHPRGVGEDD